MSLYLVFEIRFLTDFGCHKIHGTFDSFEKACESCFELKLINNIIPPHVQIIEIKINEILNISNLYCDFKYKKYYIVNLHEKCIFSNDHKLIYGKMDNNDFLKYISVLDLEIKLPSKYNSLLFHNKFFVDYARKFYHRIERFSGVFGWNPYYIYNYYKDRHLLLSCEGFIFSLNVEQIKELYDKIIEIQNKPKPKKLIKYLLDSLNLNI